MDSYARQNADRLVSRLVSEPAPERARLLAQEDPSSWDSVRLQAFREALRTARLSGRLSDAAYDDARAQIERWYRNAASSSTADLPTVLLDLDEPTEELDVISHTLQRVEPSVLVGAPNPAAPQPAPPPAPQRQEEPRRADPVSSTVSVTVQVHRPPTETPVHEVKLPGNGVAEVVEARAGSSNGASIRPAARLQGSNGSAAPAAAPATARKGASDVPSRAAVSPPAAAAVELGRAAFRPGETIRSRYVLEEQSGAGGSSYIFRARDLRRDAVFDRDAFVALKVPREHLRDRTDIADRLKREFHQTQALIHPNIVRVLDIDCEQGTWFLTMEMLDGESLSTLLACIHPQVLPQREALAILRGCAEALVFAHEHGVLHCDVKPGNIFVTRREEVRVLDFGVAGPSPAPKDVAGPSFASRDKAPRSSSRVTAATPCYASPDILEGSPPEERDDVFSFACVAYEVLTGHHPFERQSTLEARDRGMRVRRLPGLGRRQFVALERALSWNRKRRPGSVAELLVALGLVKSSRSSTGWLKGAAVLAAGAVLAALVFNMKSTSDRTPEVVAVSPPTPAAAVAQTPTRAPGAPGEEVTSGAPTPAAAPGESPPEINSRQAAASTAGARTTPVIPIQSHPLEDAPAASISPAPGAGAGPAALMARRTFAGADAAAAAASRISLEQARIVVSESAVSAVVRVRRLDDLTGRVRIQWRAIPGSAQPGSDYSMDGLGTIEVPEGQDVRVLFIPILNDQGREPNESFDVEIFSLEGPGQLGPITRATLTILDND